ncbi:MAG TPA: hypothetical protein VFU38_02025 [Candidatus Krumholzibacteria bacterium]|nr:hypothetical protein [Candidatus Krumholzibacteria bacterium]
MKTLLKIVSLGAMVALLACSANRDNDNDDLDQTLYQKVGGAEGMLRLANQFAITVQNNPTLDDELDDDDVNDLKQGLANDILRASGMTATSSESVSNVLDDEGLDANEVSALRTSLREAAAAVGLNSSTINSLTTAVIMPTASSSQTYEEPDTTRG